MTITILATLMIMAAYFLILYGGVGFIQDKRFFHPRRRRIWMQFPIRKRDFRGHISLPG